MEAHSFMPITLKAQQWVWGLPDLHCQDYIKKPYLKMNKKLKYWKVSRKVLAKAVQFSGTVVSPWAGNYPSCLHPVSVCEQSALRLRQSPETLRR